MPNCEVLLAELVPKENKYFQLARLEKIRSLLLKTKKVEDVIGFQLLPVSCAILRLNQ